MSNLMQKFIDDRKHLPKVISSLKYSEENDRPHLIITDSTVLASFMGYLKFQIQRNEVTKEVFFRGQVNNYSKIIPSLLRGDDFHVINNRFRAYTELSVKSRSLYNASRFRTENIDNIFQHYGIKSPSIDLVDNIFVALWFAQNKWVELDETSCRYEPSKEEFGWIYFMKMRNRERMKLPIFEGYVDLRKTHSSLSTRMHCQHGITYFRQLVEEWNEVNRSFDELVIASVKFPIANFKLNGNGLNQNFLFPSSEIDNTYKYLKKNRFNELLISIEDKYNLRKGDLGKIWNYIN